jgi:hypothetical protein
MCDASSDGVGELVPDSATIYRGCSRKNFLTPTRDAAQPEAFQKNGLNHTDGLSLALTVVDSVRGLGKNFGSIAISVRDIRALNRGLEVRYDTTTPNHVLIRNLPCMDRSNERAEAEAVAAELAFRATVASPNPVLFPPHIA